MLSNIDHHVNLAHADTKSLIFCLQASNNSILLPNLIKSNALQKISSIIADKNTTDDKLTICLYILNNLVDSEYLNSLEEISDITYKLITFLDSELFYEIVISIFCRLFIGTNGQIMNFVADELIDTFIDKITKRIHPKESDQCLLDISEILFFLATIHTYRKRDCLLKGLSILCAHQNNPNIIESCCDIITQFDVDTLLTCDKYQSNLTIKYKEVSFLHQNIFLKVFSYYLRKYKLNKFIFPMDLVEKSLSYYTIFNPKKTIERIKYFPNPIANLILNLGSTFCQTRTKVICTLQQVLMEISHHKITLFNDKYQIFEWLNVFLLLSVQHTHELKDICWIITHLLILYKETPEIIINTELFETIIKIIKKCLKID